MDRRRKLATKPSAIEDLRTRLAEAEETLNAIRRGEVDAIAVEGPNGRQIYTLQTPDRPYQTFTESMSEGAASLTREGTIIFCNARLAEMVGHVQEKLLGSPVTILAAPLHKKRLQQLLSLGKQNLARAEIQFLRQDGSTIPVLVSLKPLLSELSPGICLIATDLSDRKRAEDAVKAERQRFEAILDGLPTMICLLTPDYRVAFANRAFRKQFGEANGRRCYEYCFGKNVPCAFCESFEVLKTKAPHEWEVVARGRTIHAFDFPFADIDGSPLVLEMDVDITEQRQAEEKLRQASRYGRGLLEASVDPLVTISKEGKIMDANRATELATGLSRDQLIGSDFCSYFTDSEKARQGYEKAFAEGEVRDYPLAIRHRSGRVVEVLYNASVLPGEKGGVESVFAAARDVTDRKRAEQSVRDQAALLDLAHDAIIFRGLDHKIFFWNRGAKDLYGWSAQEAVGKIAHELLQTEFPRTLEELYAVLHRTREWEGELRHSCRDGKRIIVASRWSLLRDDQGNPTAVLEINRDVTARKQAEEALRKVSRYTRTLIEASLDPLLTINLEGKITDVNDATVKSTGVEREQLIGSDFCNYFTDPDKARAGYQRVFAEESVRDYPLAIRHVSGEITNVLYSATIYRSSEGDVEGVFAAARDVTARKRAEEDLRTLNQELEQRVVNRTAELQVANKELEAFSYSVSHDLRAPLRHISGFSKILSEEFGPLLPVEAQRHMQRIQEGTRRMGQLIDDLLNLSRVGRRELQCQATGLENIVREVLTDLEPECDGRDVQWNIGLLPFVDCDGALLKQVFQNLLSNALKFTRPRQHAVIEIGCKQEDGVPVIFVRDNGVGFNVKYSSKLFGVFQRMHRAEDFEGTGVGLATVQRIVQKHGGRVWAEAELDKGATFYFTLAALAKTSRESATKEEVAHELAGDRHFAGGG